MAPQALGPRAPEPIFFPVCDRLPALQELSLAKCGVAVLGAKSLKRKDARARAGLARDPGCAALHHRQYPGTQRAERLRAGSSEQEVCSGQRACWVVARGSAARSLAHASCKAAATRPAHAKQVDPASNQTLQPCLPPRPPRPPAANGSCYEARDCKLQTTLGISLGWLLTCSTSWALAGCAWAPGCLAGAGRENGSAARPSQGAAGSAGTLANQQQSVAASLGLPCPALPAGLPSCPHAARAHNQNVPLALLLVSASPCRTQHTLQNRGRAQRPRHERTACPGPGAPEAKRRHHRRGLLVPQSQDKLYALLSGEEVSLGGGAVVPATALCAWHRAAQCSQSGTALTW